MADLGAAPKRFRYDINALRALAVLAVVAYHFGLPGAASGYIGVDIFFVISGCLIGGQIHQQLAAGQFRLSAFYASRVRRIVPALVVMCAAVFVWGWFFQLPEPYKNVVRSIVAALFFVSNIAFTNDLGYFDASALFKPLLHTWSLAVESQFYLVLPLALMLAFRLRVGWQLAVLLGTLLASMGFAVYSGQHAAAAVFYAFPARVWEFLLGCWVGIYPLALVKTVGKWAPGAKPLRLLRLAAWLGLLASCFFIPKGVVWPGGWTLVPTLLTALVIGLGARLRAGPVAANALVQQVGKLSYSLYLWHWPVLVCWGLTYAQQAVPTGWAVAGLLAATWALAWLSWRWIEQPIRTNRRRWTSRRLWGAYGAALGVFVLAGAGVWAYKGAPARLPSYLQGASTAAQMPNHDRLACWELPRAPKAGQKLTCSLGSTETVTPTFAIWGDSHANHLQDAMREALVGKPLSGYVFALGGCMPALASEPVGGACDAHNEGAWNVIAGHKSIRTIVIAVRAKDEAWEAGALQTIRGLLARNYRVIYLGPLPEGTSEVASQWAADQLTQRRPIANVVIGRDQATRVQGYQQRLARWQAQVAPLAQQFPGQFLPLDVSSRFCDEAQCWLVKDGVGYLRDADHLTVAGARLVSDDLMGQIERLSANGF